MGYVQLPDEIKAIIEALVSAGRASNEEAFVRDVVLRHVAELDSEDGAFCSRLHSCHTTIQVPSVIVFLGWPSNRVARRQKVA